MAPICSPGFECFLVLVEAVLVGTLKHMRKVVLFGHPPRKLALDLPKLKVLVVMTHVVVKCLPFICDETRKTPFLTEHELPDTDAVLNEAMAVDIKAFFEEFPKMVCWKPCFQHEPKA